MFERGQIVNVQTFMDGIVERRVVGETTGTVFLCNEVEYESALEENREPVAIGFPVEDIVDRAFENLHRKKILEDANSAYRALKENKEDWQRELQERKVWENTLS